MRVVGGEIRKPQEMAREAESWELCTCSVLLGDNFVLLYLCTRTAEEAVSSVRRRRETAGHAGTKGHIEPTVTWPRGQVEPSTAMVLDQGASCVPCTVLLLYQLPKPRVHCHAVEGSCSSQKWRLRCTYKLFQKDNSSFPIENVRNIINPSQIDQSRLQCDYKRMSNPATILSIGNQILGTCFVFNPDRIGPIIWQSIKNVVIQLQF